MNSEFYKIIYNFFGRHPIRSRIAPIIKIESTKQWKAKDWEIGVPFQKLATTERGVDDDEFDFSLSDPPWEASIVIDESIQIC